MAEHNITGYRGEEIAIEYLRSGSYIILETNWRRGRFEIDIIARCDNRLIIVEVKTRSGQFIEPLLVSVNQKKQNRLIKAANNYLITRKLDLEVRFDIITVIFEEGGGHTLNHIKSAFIPLINT